MKMVAAWIASLIGVALFQQASLLEIPKSCPNLTFGSIPSNHLYHEKTKPLFIAHRGQPKKFQENTYDGIVSTIDILADGYELDIFLTKDHKLVVFHDDDTEHLTGVKKTIWKTTYEELSKLNISKNITYGGKTFIYDKTRKIPLLEDILKATKDADIIHYLEMKPNRPILGEPADLVAKTGELVAQMVQQYNLVQKAIVVSFDYRKVYAVKQNNPKITVGTLISDAFLAFPKSFIIETGFKNLAQCLKDAPSSKVGFFKFVLESGIIFKYSGSSSFDTNIDMYNNPDYTNNTISMLRKNYKDDISTGFYTMYKLAQSEDEHRKNEIKLRKLIMQGGAKRVITDDVPRARKFLGRETSSATNSYLSSYLIIFVLLTKWYV